MIAAALYSFVRFNGVTAVDVGSFIVAFVALLFFIRIPENRNDTRERVLNLAKEGLVTKTKGPSKSHLLQKYQYNET